MESLPTSTHISTMKTKKAIKYILKHPDLFSQGELEYVRLMKKERKVLKKKHESSETNISDT
tara:strand:+ start:289 stop:474 length:186 start_codon:yes stop_codon:yes gene_type:complete